MLFLIWCMRNKKIQKKSLSETERGALFLHEAKKDEAVLEEVIDTIKESNQVFPAVLKNIDQSMKVSC